MKKCIAIFLSTIGILSLIACGKDNVLEKENIVPESSAETTENSKQNEPYIVKTYGETPVEEIDECFDQGIECIYTSYYEMSDGTWQAENHTYQYRLEVFGIMNNAAKAITYVILSNTKEITFEQAWKASGLSSNLDDYFEPEEAVIVGIISSELPEQTHTENNDS